MSASSVRRVIAPGAAASSSALKAGKVRVDRARIDRSASASASSKDAPWDCGYARSLSVVTSSARCGATASRAMHASESSASNSSVR